MIQKITERERFRAVLLTTPQAKRSAPGSHGFHYRTRWRGTGECMGNKCMSAPPAYPGEAEPPGTSLDNVSLRLHESKKTTEFPCEISKCSANPSSSPLVHQRMRCRFSLQFASFNTATSLSDLSRTHPFRKPLPRRGPRSSRALLPKLLPGPSSPRN